MMNPFLLLRRRSVQNQKLGLHDLMTHLFQMYGDMVNSELHGQG
jgi:hypothetical protein